MCVYIKDKQTKILKEDTVVYKVVQVHNYRLLPKYRKSYTGNIQEYNVGSDYEQKLNISSTTYNDHYHGKLYLTKEGIYSYDSIGQAKNSMNRYDNNVVIECIIPKGSNYFKGVGPDESIFVSDRIKVVRVVKISKTRLLLAKILNNLKLIK